MLATMPDSSSGLIEMPATPRKAASVDSGCRLSSAWRSTMVTAPGMLLTPAPLGATMSMRGSAVVSAAKAGKASEAMAVKAARAVGRSRG